MVVRQLVDYLPSIAPEWSFLFLRSNELKEPLSAAPNTCEMVVEFGANHPLSMWFLPELIDLKGVDLFHSPSNILPARLPMNAVTTLHDVMWLMRPELCSARIWGKVERRFYQHGMKRALRRSDSIISVSEATRKDIIACDPSAGPKTTAILSGVSSNFRPSEVDARVLAKFGIAKNKYVLTVGQNAPYKNHESVIRGFAKAFADSPHMQLVLIQRRGLRDAALQRLCSDLRIDGRVRFVEPVDDDVLVQLYNGALALLHPSICEGFGMPLAEAMACGCPVITSDQSAMPEVTGGAALLVDPLNVEAIAHAQRRLATDADLRAELRAKGLERAAQLSWQRCAEQHLEVYKQVLQRTST
ncbi:glycosyltransferase family 4 protein [Altererythrobacter lutimaris]|uniref:Glycosyltransferase family 4 protein n=1 Tax=Altererythrobacter lutimaris TaxID=2743979 RepID=A0A850HD72_9SPHN|nr:glycosyltransferase family 1 protein [Altererythrobacter lutimaris]NVE94946.1 glycosyltransferase family 4 protein [Altererythrobacter lutimaris]